MSVRSNFGGVFRGGAGQSRRSMRARSRPTRVCRCISVSVALFTAVAPPAFWPTRILLGTGGRKTGRATGGNGRLKRNSNGTRGNATKDGPAPVSFENQSSHRRNQPNSPTRIAEEPVFVECRKADPSSLRSLLACAPSVAYAPQGRPQGKPRG